MGKKEQEELPAVKVSPFSPDGRRDFGPQGGRTGTEVRKEELQDHNARVIVGEGLYDKDHPGF